MPTRHDLLRTPEYNRSRANSDGRIGRRGRTGSEVDPRSGATRNGYPQEDPFPCAAGFSGVLSLDWRARHAFHDLVDQGARTQAAQGCIDIDLQRAGYLIGLE